MRLTTCSDGLGLRLCNVYSLRYLCSIRLRNQGLSYGVFEEPIAQLHLLGGQYITYSQLRRLEPEHKDKRIHLPPYVIGGNNLQVRRVGPDGVNVEAVAEFLPISVRLPQASASYTPTRCSDPCVRPCELLADNCTVAMQTISERILDIVMWKFQHKDVYYYPAIPHFQVRAALTSARCTLADDEVQRSSD